MLEQIKKIKKDELLPFIAICFGLSILLSLFMDFTGGHESKYLQGGYFSMLIPAIAVMVMKYVFNAPVTRDHKTNLSIGWVLLALLLMPVLIHAVCLPLFAFLNNNSLPWQSWLTTNNEGLYISPEDHGWGTLTFYELLFRIFINLISGLIIVSLLAFFEEIGWRAWMLPRLIKSFNTKKGIVIGALIWAVWHIPFMLSGIIYFKGISRYQVILINPLGIFGVGIIIGWFWLKTKSILIVSLAHGALNNWGQYVFKYMQDSAVDFYAQQFWLLVAVNGSLLVCGLIILLTIKNDGSNCDVEYANSASAKMNRRFRTGKLT
jgi:membrane protease YdiL (CAAX protease family)